MISIVIRNRNEAKALENVLSIVTKVYSEDYTEIIIVDNYSTDDSVSIAEKYKCKVVYIKDFSYGGATNLGIETAKSDYVLLLSSHAIPIGQSFFKNSITALKSKEKIAGIRYINSIENYKRAVKNNFIVFQPLHYGLMTACALVNKKVWEQFKFDERLSAIEDKEWSERVANKGFEILDLNETFFYFIKRSRKSNILRYKNETISEYLLHKKKYQSVVVIVASFFKKIIVINTKNYFKTLIYDILILKTRLEIYRKLKK
ncbi:glycosyltransferase family 2 protein [Flavobacterium pectinovorum]|uniref:glycosyltransferase family 2 protein n=1 Tax=Flavobacterium pectinovorum TaxID=29533 RepID=UPI001FAC3633|nr:glycosyltransferase [Flavobacterium pectinovorum]MCI9843890.1 glycosyltransferase [Flavobacterium pectinovorum]